MKHKNRHAGGRHRHQFFAPEGRSDLAGYGRHHHGRGGGGRRGGRHRLFDYGEMRLLVLSLIGENPTYGYELIKTIEDKFAGSYTPSPGVIYPTLTWLEEAGHIRPAEQSGRKTYHITPEGRRIWRPIVRTCTPFLPVLPAPMRQNMAGGGMHRYPCCARWKT